MRITNLSFSSWIILSLFICSSVVYPQKFTLNEIKTNLLNNPPNTGDQILREESILSLDHILKQDSAQTSPAVVNFYHSMLENVHSEFHDPVSSTTIWLIYNHGFVIKTPETTLAFDLVTGYVGTGYHPLFDTLKEHIKIMFVSHFHGDHNSNDIASAVESNGGYIFTPNNMSPGDSLTLLGCRIKAYDGLHSTALRIFEIITPSGLKILHTGDNQTSQTLPLVKDVDVLLLNAWVNESGWRSAVVGMRNCLNKLNPALMLPGHIQEMGHDYDPYNIRGRVTYEEAYEVDDIPLSTKVMVMAWGERYEYPDTYDKPYVYTTKTLAPFIPANEDTVRILSEIINPKNQNISVEALIENEVKDIIDTTTLYDDGLHEDGSADDGFYGGSWSKISDKSIYNVHVSLRSIDTDNSDVFYKVARFTNIGPIVFDSYTISNPFGTLYTLKLSLKNEGVLTAATNITAGLSTKDSESVSSIVSGSGDGEYIDAGETVELVQSFSVFSTGAADTIPITISIFSNGYHFWTDSFLIDLTPLSIIKDEMIPKSFSLSQNYPNPFNPSTMISYQLPINSYIDLKVFNLLGQKVTTLVSENQSAGNHQVQWDASGYPSGIYYYRIEAGEYQQVRKMILLR